MFLFDEPAQSEQGRKARPDYVPPSEGAWAEIPDPNFRGVDDGLARAMDRHRWAACGNGQVSRVAAEAFTRLAGTLTAGKRNTPNDSLSRQGGADEA